MSKRSWLGCETKAVTAVRLGHLPGLFKQAKKAKRDFLSAATTCSFTAPRYFFGGGGVLLIGKEMVFFTVS